MSDSTKTRTDMVAALLDYAEVAGPIAMQRGEGGSDLTAQLKSDDSYVTQIDMELSERALQHFSEVVPPEHIISEEHLDNLHRLPAEPSDDETLVIIDPIDGTRNYYHGIPLYGISVGVLRNRRPWMGMVAFPELGEIYYADGESVYLITDAYGPKRHTRRLDPPSTVVNSNAVMLFTNSYTRLYGWTYDVCTWLVTACAALNACWPLVGRSVGTVFTDHIWDFAGAWAMLELLGLELRGYKSGRRIDRYDPADYHVDSLLLREPMIVCRPEHFDALRKGVVERG